MHESLHHAAAGMRPSSQSTIFISHSHLLWPLTPVAKLARLATPVHAIHTLHEERQSAQVWPYQLAQLDSAPHTEHACWKGKV